MSFFLKFLEKKLAMPGLNFFKRLYLLRKVYITNLYRTYNSNYGEDIVLNGLFLKDIESGFFVDVGCFHPRKFNNTFKLYKKGWRGINIDFDELKIEAFKMLRPEDINVVAAISNKEADVEIYDYGNWSVHSTIDEVAAKEKQVTLKNKRKVRTKTLDKVIESTPYSGRKIDLLSVDTEGHDLNVLRSLDFDKYCPKIILVESFLYNLDLILDSDLYRFLKGRGYYFINWVGLTLIFCHEDCDIIIPEVEFKGK